MMKFGIVLPTYGPYCKKEFAKKAAIEAEKNGFDSLLVWDHYMLPYGKKTFDSYILLSYLAAETDRIKLGTCVTPLPFRNPAVLAKMISSLDILSCGRTIIGIGAGWSREEFEGYSTWDGAGVRVRKTEEALKLMIKLWTEERVNFEGDFYSASGAVLEPKTVQKPHPPLWVGSTGKKMLKLAAEYGSGWIPIDISADLYGKYATILRNLLRKKDNFVFSFVDWPRKGAELETRIEEFRRAGCEYYCAILRKNKKEALEQLDELAELKNRFR